MEPKKAKSIFLQAVEQYAPSSGPPIWTKPAAKTRICGMAWSSQRQENVDLAELGRAAWNEACPPSTNLPWKSLAPSHRPYKLLQEIGEGAWAWSTWPSKTSRSGAAWP